MLTKVDELNKRIQRALEDESWQATDEEDRKVDRDYLIRKLVRADVMGWDLDETYNNVLRGLRVMRDGHG